MTDENHVDIRLYVTAQNSAATIPVHPAIYPATFRLLPINVVKGIVHPVTMAIHWNGLKAFNIQIGRVQANILAQTERRERRPRS